MTTPKILAFSGSARQGSLNKKALAVAVQGAREGGAEVTVLELRDYPLPLYDGDIEAKGDPENADRLRAVFSAHQGLLIAAPEYNSSITPLLKNTIDWVSRKGGKLDLSAYKGKTAGLVAASGGGLGGLRGLVHVRQILGNIGVHVIPDQHALARAGDAFDAYGKVKDAGQEAALKGVGAKLAETTRRLNP